MAAGKFRLEQILGHKRRLEEAGQLELHALQLEERRLQDELNALRTREREQIDALSGHARVGVVDAERLQATLAYVATLGLAIGRQEALISECAARVEEQRESLVGLLQEKQSLEMLKRKQETADQLETDRREARDVDDVTSARYVRRQREV